MAKASQNTPTPASVGSPIPEPKRRSRKIKKPIHPDTRPCPSWCYVGIENDRESYDHEIQDHRISEAVHILDKLMSTRASLYPASTDSATRVVKTAEVVSHLEQVGQGLPMVRLGLRTYPRERGADGLYRGRMEYADILKLTVEDAQELAEMLTYLVDLAKR